MRTVCYTLVFCTLAVACSAPVKQDLWVEFALTTSNHVSDWQQVRTALQTAGVECQENGSSVGTLSFSVAQGNFDRAKPIAVRLITSNSLTLRMKKQKDSPLFEVYQDGKKVAEESYSAQ
jgi:uncharacterized protein YabE (DUF348 family)